MADTQNVVSSIFKLADTGLNVASVVVGQKNLENDLYDSRSGTWIKSSGVSSYASQVNSLSAKNLNTTLIIAVSGVALVFIVSKVIKRKRK